MVRVAAGTKGIRVTVDHRALTLQLLRVSGIIPVRVRYGQKDPFPEWDPRQAALEDKEATIKLLESPKFEFNIGGLFHGRWVDVDIDTKEDNPTLRAALDMLLPPTRHTWGRLSKPDSHRLYCLQEEMDRAPWASQLRTIKGAALGEESYSIEVRGGKPENGLFTVMPGSLHPSGEWVEWGRNVDPTVSAPTLPLFRLIKQIRLAQAAAMVVPFWQEGMRNDLSLALSGLMWRIRQAALTIGGYDDEDDIQDDETFVLRRKDAENLLKTIMKLAGDDEGDQRSRLINMSNSWDKLDKDPGARVSGGKMFAELAGENGETLVKSLYRLLSDNSGAEQLEELTNQFVMWYGQGVLIDTDMVDKGLDNPYMTKDQAANSLAGRKVRMGDKKVPVVAILFGTSILQRVYGLTFDPTTTERIVETELGVRVNQWRGFRVAPSPQMVLDEEMEPLLDYVLTVLANGNQQHADWILDWCADIFQDPGNKPGTSLVLVGPHGSGKTFLGEQVLGKIVGGTHYAQFNSIASLTDKFNAVSENKVLVQCDEAMHSHQKEVAAKLKSLITDETLTVERKMINSYRAPSHMRILFTSNDEQAAVFIDPSPYERRYMVCKVSGLRAKDMEYWTQMRSWAAMALPKILRWMLDRKYDKATVRRPIETEAKHELQRVSVDLEVSWIISRILDGFPLGENAHQHWWQAFQDDRITANDVKRNTLRRDVWPNHVYLPALQTDLRDYIRRHGRPVYTGSLVSSIRRVLPPGSLDIAGQRSVEYNDPRHGQPVKERIRLYTFPTKGEILEYLQKKYGAMIDKLIENETSEAKDLNHIGVGKGAPVKEEEY